MEHDVTSLWERKKKELNPSIQEGTLCSGSGVVLLSFHTLVKGYPARSFPSLLPFLPKICQGHIKTRERYLHAVVESRARNKKQKQKQRKAGQKKYHHHQPTTLRIGQGKYHQRNKNYQSCVCWASSGAAYWHAKTPDLNLIPPPFPDRSPATESKTNSQNCRHRKKSEKRYKSQSECDDGKQQSQK